MSDIAMAAGAIVIDPTLSVQGVDVETETVYMTLAIGVPGELEGISFILNEETEKYDMIVVTRSTTPAMYYRFEFS